MACSKFEYVKKFEHHDELLLQTYTIVRIDGKGFTKFCERHKFRKPNDIRCIGLMNAAAEFVMNKFQDIFLAYGQSDQYSFALKPESELFNRRSEKIVTCITSCFTSAFVFRWKEFFSDMELKEPPIFDGRTVSYPNIVTLKDYFRWRQADCHINNLYNTVFWCMVKSGKSNTEVENMLKDTHSGQKNEILFKDFGINYNNVEEVYRKGTVIAYFEKQSAPLLEETEKPSASKPVQQEEAVSESKDSQTTITESKTTEEGKPEQKILNTEPPHPDPKIPKKKKPKFNLQQRHTDIIREEFWATIRM